MDNDEFLKKVIEYSNLIDKDSIKFILDLADNIVWAGNGMVLVIDIDIKDIIGKNYLLAAPVPPENHIPIINCINKVKTELQRQDFLSVNLNHERDYLLLHCRLNPLINLSNNQLVAISVESTPVEFTLYFANLLNHLHPQPILCSKKYTDELLTKREHEIAFLLFHTVNSEQIASILSLFAAKAVTAKTIRNIISQQLLPKLKVYNKPALLIKLRELGYHKKIPPTLLTNLHIDLATL